MTIADEIRADREKGARRIETDYKARLCGIAANLGLDWSEAEALVYGTIAEAVKSIDRYDERAQFFPWLVKIMVNLHGKATRRKAHARVEYAAELPEPAEEADGSGGADSIFEAVDGEILRNAIQLLPLDMREAVVLHYFMDVPVLKMAKVLSLPVGTVKSRLHCARLVLAKRLNIRRATTGLAVFLLLALGTWAAVRLLPRTYYWKPGGTMARYDELSNWSTEGTAGAAADELPGADAQLYGSGNYAFDIAGGAGRTLFGWETPGDWDDHYLVVANGELRFRGDVSTHTGELTIERGGELTFLEGSTYTPALFSAGKWTTRVKAGGVFNLFGRFKGYSYRILVEPGGRATLRPQYWGGARASEQADNAVENYGELNLPQGLVWQQGGGNAERYSVALRQNAGRLTLGGPIAKAADIRNTMTLSLHFAGGTVHATGDVSFAADSARLEGGVAFVVEKGATLDLSTVVVADGADLSFAGGGTAILPAGNYGRIDTADDGTRVVRDGAAAADALVLRGGETLTITEDTALTNGLAFVRGENGELPTLEIARGATLTVPGNTRFGNVRLKIAGTLAAAGPGDLTLGYARVGERAVFALDIDGGTVSNAFGNIDFFSPTFGGTVAAAGDARLTDATLWTDERHAFNFGRNNPDGERVVVALRRTALDYGTGIYYIAGGLVLDFADGARLYRRDAAGEQADLIVKGAACLRFGPGGDLHYGASANAFGSVGNGGISFLPSVDGHRALVLDRATFWYHHPNSIRGRTKATLCATNAVYEVRGKDWNYTPPFSGFKRVEGNVKIMKNDEL